MSIHIILQFSHYELSDGVVAVVAFDATVLACSATDSAVARACATPLRLCREATVMGQASGPLDIRGTTASWTQSSRPLSRTE